MARRRRPVPPEAGSCDDDGDASRALDLARALNRAQELTGNLTSFGMNDLMILDNNNAALALASALACVARLVSGVDFN